MQTKGFYSMDNELIKEKSFWQRYKMWLIGTGTLALLAMGILYAINRKGIARAYSDKPLYEAAIYEANSNEEVVMALGKLKPLDRMAIAEGNVQYNGDSVASTITVKGTKGNGKMDIAAHKVNGVWKYDSIKIRVKEPSQEIRVMSGD